MKKKLMTTPIVSAIQETTVPPTTPKTTPFAVEMKMDGRKPTTLMTMLMIMLMTDGPAPEGAQVVDGPVEVAAHREVQTVV